MASPTRLLWQPDRERQISPLTRDIDALQSLPFIERILAYEDFDTALSNWLMARRGRRHHSWDWRLDLRAAQRSWKRYAAAVRKARKWRAAA